MCDTLLAPERGRRPGEVAAVRLTRFEQGSYACQHGVWHSSREDAKNAQNLETCHYRQYPSETLTHRMDSALLTLQRYVRIVPRISLVCTLER